MHLAIWWDDLVMKETQMNKETAEELMPLLQEEMTNMSEDRVTTRRLPRLKTD